MRVVVNQFMSLDGVLQAPGGAEEDTDGGFAHGGWSMPYFDPEAMGPVLDEGLGRAEALLFGRRTWQVMAAAWPGRAGDPFADRMNALPKHVASRTLTDADMTWAGSRLLRPDHVLDDIAALRAHPGGDLLLMGSTVLARELVANALVDEYNLMIEPIVLGGGKRLFSDDGQARRLELVRSVTASTGVLVCTYRPAV